MTCRQPITSAIAILVVVLGAAACSNKKDVEYAKRSLYDTDFAKVYAAALEATREAYPNLEDYPGKGMVKTAWHQVTYASSSDDMAQTRSFSPVGAGGMGAGNQMGAAGQPTRLAYKRFYIQFEVSVVGGRPWRVKVVGRASEWEPGNAMPTELRGPARPHWLEGRTDALAVAIYKRIKRYAVRMPDEQKDESKPEDVLPKTDPKAFAGLPAGAPEQLASLKDAVSRRDYDLLRTRVADDVVWSLGGDPSIDTALVMWQADSEALAAMERAIADGCVAATPARITCPGGDPVAGAWQLVIELRNGAWKVTSFVKAE